MLYAWLAVPLVDSVRSCPLAFHGRDAKIPHTLVLQQLPEGFKDGDSCDVFFQHELALQLLRMKAAEEWSFHTVEYRQSSLKNFSVLRTLQHLGAVEVPEQAAAASSSSAQPASEDVDAEFFDSPFLKLSAKLPSEPVYPVDPKANKRGRGEKKGVDRSVDSDIEADLLFGGDGDDDPSEDSDFDDGDPGESGEPGEPPGAGSLDGADHGPQAHKAHEQATDKALLASILGS
ncbi:unnamed protein product, partial [Symbiodinium sp. CCMP2592]